MSKIQERLKEQRLKKGYTLARLAELLDVKEATVQRYESGEIKNIKHETIARLASVLNCSPCYLMGWTDIEAAGSKIKEEPIIEKYNRLNALGKQKASEYIQDLSEQEKYTKSIEDEDVRYEGMQLAAFGGDMKGTPRKKKVRISP